MTSREQARKEPTLADLEAFERLLRESLAKDQSHVLAQETSGQSALPVGKAANDSVAPSTQAPSADPLAELARMIEAPLDFGLPPLPPRQTRPANEPAETAKAVTEASEAATPGALAEPLRDQPAPFEPADFHGKGHLSASGEPGQRDPIDLDLLLGRVHPAPTPTAPTMPEHPDAIQVTESPTEAAPAPAELGPIVAPLAAKPEAAELDPLAAFEEELRRFDLRLHEPRPATTALAPSQAAASGWPEASWQDSGGSSTPAAAAPGTLDEPPVPGMAQSLEQNEERLAAAAAAAAAATGAGKTRARRSTGVFFALGGIAVAGLAAIGATFAFSERPRQIASGQVPVIAAKAEPAKEKPANPGGVEIPNQNKQVLATKDAKPDTGPAQVVNTTEQPIDLREVTRREPVRVIAPSPFQSTPPAAATPPAAPSATETAAAPPPASQSPAEPAPEARRVQSVRIGDPIVPQTTASVVPPASAAAIAAGSAAIAAIASGASTPRAGTPAAPQSGASRPAAVPPTNPSASVAALPPASDPPPPKVESRPDTAAPSAPRANPPAPRPREVARPPAQRSANAPLNLNPPRPVQPVPAARPAAGGGSFAVQLASRPSEAEAATASGQLRSRYAGQLGGRATNVVSGTANGQTVYRVRAGGYASLADANAACNRIKAAGGSCFPTRQ